MKKGTQKGALFKTNPGNNLLSQRVAPSLPSAHGGLTAVFGMGTGVSHHGILTREISHSKLNRLVG